MVIREQWGTCEWYTLTSVSVVCIFAVLKWLGCEVVSVEINVRQRGTKYFSFFIFVCYIFFCYMVISDLVVSFLAFIFCRERPGLFSRSAKQCGWFKLQQSLVSRVFCIFEGDIHIRLIQEISRVFNCKLRFRKFCEPKGEIHI